MRRCDYCGDPMFVGIGTIALHPRCEAKLGKPNGRNEVPNNQDRNIEALHIHIEGLQATLTKRNARIAELEKRLADPSSDIEKARKKGWKDGWQACAATLSNATDACARELSKINREAWTTYLAANKGKAE